jgi:hypothetical protein
VTDFMVRAKLFEALAKVTTPLVENDVFRKRLGHSARVRAVREFSKESCAAKHLAAYDVAMSGLRERSGAEVQRNVKTGSSCYGINYSKSISSWINESKTDGGH